MAQPKPESPRQQLLQLPPLSILLLPEFVDLPIFIDVNL